MFKLYEKDKCVTLQLDLATVGSAGHKVEDIVPGTILYDGATGAVDAASTTGGAKTITEATAGLFYIAMDYYANTLNYSYPQSEVPGEGTTAKGSGKIAAIPVLEYFTASLPLAIDLDKGDMLTIAAGVWAKGNGSSHYVCAMVSEANGWSSGDPLTTKITTWCARYTQGS